MLARNAWENRKLSEVTNLITKGTTPREKGGRGEVNFIKVENLSKNGNIFTTSKVSVSEHQGYLARSILQENDIPFSIAGSLGRTAIVPKLVLPANTNQALAIIRLSTGCVEFVATYLSGEAIDRYIRRNPTVGAQPNISLTQVASLQIDWPSLHEQEVISKLFARVKDLIAATQDKIDALEQAKRALLQRLFDQSWRFKGYSDPWEKRKLGELAEFINGRAYKQDELLASGKYPVLRVGNFYTNDKWYYSNLELPEKYYAEEGDLLYTWSATFGPHIWIGPRVIYHYHIWKVALKNIFEKDFALQFFEADRVRLLNSTNGSTMIHVTKKDMESKGVLLPDVYEQRTIGDLLKRVDHLIAATQSRLSSLELLKKALLQDLFI